LGIELGLGKMATAIEQTIEGKNLEQNQRKAVLTDGKNICVNAGAGSGKTFTILAKVLHLLDQQIAKPEEIVVVAYNNRVAAELRTRISKLSSSFPNLKEKLKRISISEGEECPECNQKIEVALHRCESNKKYIERKIHTFHSYCYDQLKKNETKKLAKFLEPKENKLIELRKAKFFEGLVQEIGSKNKAFYKKINKFFLSYLQSYKNIFEDITSMEEYVRLIKPRQVALKIVEEDDEEVHLQVKSIEELEIANFLYLRGIEFKYEDEYKGKLPDQWDRWDDSRTYKPDFHLFKKNEKGEIEYDEYYEHFALDKKLNPPKYFRDIEKYKKDYEIKKKLFDGKLICTYSYQKIDDTLFDSLVKQLRARGIKVPDENVVSDEEAIEKFREAGYFTYFASLLSNFLTHFKLRESKLTKLKSKVDTSWFKKLFEGTENKRARVFVEIFELIYTGYQQKLQKDSRVDYEDMLIEGKKYIENQNLKFLIVDEFQDISPLRARVLQQIQKYNKNIQLFSVGDDWQSIYRFSGGDIKIIVKQYDQYFGKREMVDLGLTYRFNDRLCELTSSFILKNKDGQLDKKIRGRQDYNEIPLSIFKQTTSERSRFKINFSLKIHLLKVLDKIFKEEGNSKLKILFLARYNDYIYRNGYEDLKRYIYSIFKSKKRFIEFSTVHRAKGDEADYVFLMNVNDGYLGFPSTIENDPILNLVVDDIDNFEHEEERRLFYVALTRTKKRVYLYGERGAYFIEEIHKDKNNKKDHHYESADIPVLDDPNKVVVIGYVKGNKKEVKDTTPAKNIGLKLGDEIIQVNDKKNPRKKDLIKALRDCEGREINLHIKNKSGAIIKKIKPFNKSEGKKIKKRYDIGATFFEREVDPFIDKLLKEYSLDVKKEEVGRK